MKKDALVTGASSLVKYFPHIADNIIKKITLRR